MLHISPSQIVNWRGCQRRYWFEYGPHATERTPETPSQALGRVLHAQIAAWVDSGVTPADPRAAIALTEVPHPPRAWAAEVGWAEVLTDSVALRGTIDMVDLTDPTPVVLDWKTTGDLARRMLTPEMLARDVQMTMYGQQTLARLPGVDTIVLRHAYLRTRGRPKVAVSECTVTRTELAQQRIQHLRDAKRMLALRVVTDGTAVEPDGRRKNACWRFGRCPHLETCEAMPHRPTSLLSPDTGRRPDAAPMATIDNCDETLRAKILDTKTKRAEYEAMADGFKQQIASLKTKAAKPKPWDPPAGAPDPKATEPKTPGPVDGDASPAPANEGDTLFIGAVPPRGVVVGMVERWAAPLGAQASERLGCDWRLAPFAAGTAALRTLAETAPVPTALYCGIGGDVGDALVSVLKTRFRRSVWVCGHCGEPRASLGADGAA